MDLNRDQAVDLADHRYLIESILGTSFGDANLDGLFNSSDLVVIFQAGQYEDAVRGNSTWSTGDWNCDGEFDTQDLVLAFQGGQYSAASIPAARQSSPLIGDASEPKLTLPALDLIFASLADDSNRDSRLTGRDRQRVM